MKNLPIFLILISSLFIFQNCQTYTSIQIETIVPAKIDFPGNYNKIVFINLENDLNGDNEIDTMLYRIITDEMSLGFLQGIHSSLGVDSSKFLYVKGFPDKNTLYLKDTVNWYYLNKISGNSNADIFVILDSLNLVMNSEKLVDHYSYPVEYYKYREIAVNAYWSVFDLVDKKRLDQYHYLDTLYWEAIGYSEVEAERKLMGVERSIREVSYFTAVDYANRIFPGWQTETRIYFITGNKDFKRAALFAKQNDWDSASEIWKQYVNDLDKEIASRAAFNLAVANELNGRFLKAIGWAERSNEIKSKSRTRYYISHLKNRQEQLEKLQEQIY